MVYSPPGMQNILAELNYSILILRHFLNQTKPEAGDFIFCDPPYDTDFSTYAKNSFAKDDHQRLANYLKRCEAMFMLVIKSTPFILDLYSNTGLNIINFEKKYLVSFMNRNDHDAEHLMITNYQMPGLEREE